MSTPTASAEHLGFLSVSETSSQGFLGGLLILNRSGHPIEFHCTVPVHANRAQEILYGETLGSFLCAQQIAPSLYKHKKTPVAAVITDAPLLLSFAQTLDVPLLLLLDPMPAGIRTALPGTISPRLDEICAIGRTDPAGWQEAEDEGIRYMLRADESKSRAAQILRPFRKLIDLTEPFDRIYLAIKESQKGA
ncbi:MAG: hypothetical protein J6S40_01140 [Thermoguttaceae bacterium]|nr:hypothetical protein [Thermoguttaceae bacterium]